jgi:hypothetical protein
MQKLKSRVKDLISTKYSVCDHVSFDVEFKVLNMWTDVYNQVGHQVMDQVRGEFMYEDML